MLKSHVILRSAIWAMRWPPILCLGLLAIAFVSGPANADQANDRGPDREIPERIDLRVSAAPFSCTVVMAARNDLVLVGNNEDRDHSQTIVTFIPATEAYYGRIIFGYDDAPVQGGMNDQGLFIDGNALAPTGWKPEPDKPTFSGHVMMVILGICATCEDVKAFLKKSNFLALERARFPVADRSGASLVVEYGQGHVQFVKSVTWYQIATNFVMSNIKDGDYPCWRYRAADKILSGAKELNLELIRDVLEKTHQEGGSLTVYSNIYDLKKGIVHVYNLRNFEEVVVMNLSEELKKGQRRLELGSLFRPAGGEALPTLDKILQKYTEASGGKEAIEKIRTRKLRGELTHDFPGQNPPKTVLPAEVIASAPDKWRLILKTSKGVQQMGFDGKRGWTQDADRILIDDGRPARGWPICSTRKARSISKSSFPIWLSIKVFNLAAGRNTPSRRQDCRKDGTHSTLTPKQGS